MSGKTVGVYLRDSTEAELDRRGKNRSTVINRDLERLYTLYRRALAEVRLAVPEACLIADALNGTVLDAVTAHALWLSIQDSITLEGLDAKWGVDGPALVAKLQKLPAFHCMSIVDAAERFWEMSQDGSMEDRVRQCFQIEPEPPRG